MSEKAGKPIDPAHEAKLAARREKYNAKVWAANPKTQGLKSAYDAALQQLQQLRDGTFCRQFAQMQQWCKREAMEQQLMRVEGERGRRHIEAVVAKAGEKAAEWHLKKVQDEALKVELAKEDLEDSQELVEQQAMFTDTWQGKFEELKELAKSGGISLAAILEIQNRKVGATK